MICRKCGAQLCEGDFFCQKCGAEVKEEVICQKCGQVYRKELEVCPRCGFLSQSQQIKKNNWPRSRKIALAVMCFFFIGYIVLVIGSIVSEKKEKNDVSDDVFENLEEEIYDTGIELSDNLDDFTVEIDGVVYRLPMEIEAFTKNGWRFPDYFSDEDYEKIIDTDQTDLAYLLKGDNQICVKIFNMSGNQKKFRECPIGRIVIEFPNDVQVRLAGDYLLNGKTMDEVIQQYGEPTSKEEYDSKIEVMYEKTGSEWIYERYTFVFAPDTKEVKELNVVNFVKTESVENDNSDIGYLANYVAPGELGDDVVGYNVSIMGDIYNLPAPVSEFINNGWEIITSCDVGAGTYVNHVFTMKKNGVTAEFGVYNFSSKQVEAKDATVYFVSTASYEQPELDLVLPGNIKLGMSRKEVESILDTIDELKKEENNNSVTYTMVRSRSMVLIYISDENVVNSIEVYRKECPYK